MMIEKFCGMAQVSAYLISSYTILAQVILGYTLGNERQMQKKSSVIYSNHVPTLATSPHLPGNH